MTEPIWINLRVIKAFHDRQINEHGGLPGLRDEGLLLSALSRPENAYHYSDPKPGTAELAAAYGFGLAKNHPFNDANKRTALIAMRLFLKLNGYDLAALPAVSYSLLRTLQTGSNIVCCILLEKDNPNKIYIVIFYECSMLCCP